MPSSTRTVIEVDSEVSNERDGERFGLRVEQLGRCVERFGNHSRVVPAALRKEVRRFDAGGSSRGSRPDRVEHSEGDTIAPSTTDE